MTETLVIRRFALLLRQIAEEHPKWTQSRIAQELGVSAGVVSKALKGSKVTLDSRTILEAVQRFGVASAFFFEADELDVEPHYLDYRRGRPGTGEPPMWAAFRENWRPFERLTLTERAALRALISTEHFVTDWTDWVAPAEWLLAHRRS